MRTDISEVGDKTVAIKAWRWLVALPLVFGCVFVTLVWQRYETAREEEAKALWVANRPRPKPHAKPASTPTDIKKLPVKATMTATAPVSLPAAPVEQVLPPPLPEAEPVVASAPVGKPSPRPGLPDNQLVSAGTRISVANFGIIGRAILKGTPAPEKDLPMDPTCGKLNAVKLKTRLYVVGTNEGLADVFVQIKGLSGTPPSMPLEPVLLDQRGCQFSPYVLAAQTGQRLLVHNSDPVLHNVHTTPTNSGNQESNKAQMPNGPDIQYAFGAPEMFLRLKCDVHPWMFAYVCVADHPYFAVTDPDGNFRLPQLPPGYYVIEATHRKAGAQTRTITVLPGKVAVENFVFEAK